MRKQPRKLFVVGVGRSGTSLLQSMLASHEQISFVPETGFLRRYVMQGELQKSYEKDGWDAVRELLADDPRVSRVNDKIQLHEIKVETPKSVDLAVYKQILAHEKATFVGDKDPKLIEWIEAICSLWPDSRVVHMIRDPRDVLLSKKKADWSKNNSTYYNIVASAAQMRLGRLFEEKMGYERVKLVKYESLLADPETTLRETCDWLNLDYRPTMLRFGEAASQLVSEKELQWKKETLGPLLQQNMNKWQTELSQLETVVIQHCCSESMLVGKYKPDERRASVWLTGVAAICNTVCQLVTMLFVHRQLIKNRAAIRRFSK